MLIQPAIHRFSLPRSAEVFDVSTSLGIQVVRHSMPISAQIVALLKN